MLDYRLEPFGVLEIRFRRCESKSLTTSLSAPAEIDLDRILSDDSNAWPAAHVSYPRMDIRIRLSGALIQTTSSSHTPPAILARTASSVYPVSAQNLGIVIRSITALLRQRRQGPAILSPLDDPRLNLD